MPSVKIKDYRPGADRRGKVWEILGIKKIDIWKMKDGKGVFFIIMDKDNCQKLLEEDVKEAFKNNDYEIVNPPDLNANRTIVVRNLDRQIDDWSESSIIEYITARNTWIKIESVYKLPTTSKMLKIKCEKEEMADRAIKDGLFICYQHIRPEFIEKELFIKLTPCFNCYKYNHLTKDCTLEKQTICSICAERDHTQDGCSNDPKCINCSGQHRTLAAACPIRKQLIKEKSKQIRQRRRSQSRSAARQRTYAEAAKKAPPPQQQQQPTYAFPKVPENFASIIVSSIAYAHFMEAIQPGTFQKHIDEMYELNGIPKVKFPYNINTEGVFKAFSEANVQKEKEKEKEKETQDEMSRETTISEGAVALDELLPRVMETEEKTKRQRAEMESPTDIRETREEKRRDHGVAKLDSQIPPPMPEPPKEPREKRKEREGRPSTPTTAEQRGESLPREEITRETLERIKVKIYGHRSGNYVLNREGKERMKKHVMQGKAKIIWNVPELDKRQIIKALLQNYITNEQCDFHVVGDSEFQSIPEGYTKPKRHSSTTYDL